LPQWGTLFARAVTETARHRTATLAEHRRILVAATARAGDDPTAVAVLEAFRSAPAVSAESLRDLVPHDPRPALTRLRTAGILTPHPRLPGGALTEPRLLALLDAPYAPPADR
ncbi:hypothetical protein, partial [Kitasatospora sp. A2-31]|nr:hypothetical protein [Kitasatospora sp. A2-31]